MRTLLLLCVCVSVCVSAARAQDPDYDSYDTDTKTKNVTTSPETTVDVRGHRPTTRGRDTYTPNSYAPPPISGGARYRGRPSTTPTGAQKVQEKEVQPDEGGCTHAAEEM
ncbi:fibrinogen beta chain-like, partial [Notothenia coriiceps]|uniref:Fibrinogen beta chain-like n=1 Tax=Notothenia coriiceps TaxID=8208 RepID=A0A6I9N0P3_9TELE